MLTVHGNTLFFNVRGNEKFRNIAFNIEMVILATIDELTIFSGHDVTIGRLRGCTGEELQRAVERGDSCTSIFESLHKINVYCICCNETSISLLRFQYKY